VAFGTFMVCLAYPQVDSMRKLIGQGIHATADVVGARVSSCAHGFDKTYDVRYRFRLSRDGPV
jgi:hypothetical protein